MRRIGLIVFILFTCFSCNKESAPDLFSSFGEEVTISRDLDNFTILFIEDEFDVELIQDSQQRIEISFGKNVIDKIESNVKESTLVLKNANKFNWVRKLGKRIKVKLHCAKIDQIEINGDGSLYNRDTFYGDTLNFDHAGTNEIDLILKSQWATFRCSNVGSITLKGSCGILSGTVEETASFNGKDFLASDAYFFHYSLSDSYIRGEKIYGLNLFGRGNLIYMQEPLFKFDKKETGSGKVIKF